MTIHKFRSDMHQHRFDPWRKEEKPRQIYQREYYQRNRERKLAEAKARHERKRAEAAAD